MLFELNLLIRNGRISSICSGYRKLAINRALRLMVNLVLSNDWGFGNILRGEVGGGSFGLHRDFQQAYPDYSKSLKLNEINIQAGETVESASAEEIALNTS